VVGLVGRAVVDQAAGGVVVGAVEVEVGEDFVGSIQHNRMERFFIRVGMGPWMRRRFH
jgi:hypothetical protein